MTFNTPVRVSAGARLHLGLLDLANATPRAFGGLGCILSKPQVQVSAVLADQTAVVGINEEDAAGVRDWVQDYVQVQRLSPVSLDIARTFPSHAGFGSRTVTVLASLTATALVNGSEVVPEVIQRASGRGGTSGIGVHGFFEGGWIVDLGQRRPVQNLPSRAQHQRPPSLRLRSIAPPDWTVGLFLPTGLRLSGESEVAFFRNTSVSSQDVLNGLALLYHGLVPALMEADFDTFAVCLQRFQSVGFKAAEIAHQGGRVSSLMRGLQRLTPAVGMSSLGPLVFSIFPSPDVLPAWNDIAQEFDSLFWSTTVASQGWSHG